ncbi:PH domain-containing protein [Nocardia tengchongensis]|uniref:PH domain-containing protein n=2 Tax=Nocardia tengchongensis TaxID=2055889 RepID=A0ABX8CUG6_9NOCA|nr:PH domain-containing protein [Nocardia tengchongensis]
MGVMSQPLAPGGLLADPARRPSPRAKLLWALSAALSWVVPILGVGIWALFDTHRRGLQGLVLGIVLLAAVFSIVVVPLWRYAVHRWEITDEAVYTRTGWFTQESRVAPITRVQTVDTYRGPLERVLGLATVTVTTASSAGAVHISALALADARDTVTQLTAIAARHRGDAT